MKGFYNINRYFKIGVVCAKLAFSVNSATECEIEIKQRRKTPDLILVIIFKCPVLVMPVNIRRISVLDIHSVGIIRVFIGQT